MAPKTSLNLDAVVRKVNAALPGALLSHESFDQDDRITVDPARIRDLGRLLKSDPELDFTLLVDLTCVDYIDETPRFEMIYQLFSMSRNYRLRVKARLADGQPIDSLCAVWRVADPLEREVFDMFGVPFNEHPNLTRILMYEGFEGHPLRKDYPLKKHQPIVELRTPIVTRDDPPYNWTKTQRRQRLELDD